MFVAKVKCGKLHAACQYAVCWTTRKDEKDNGELVSNATIHHSEEDARNARDQIVDNRDGSHAMYAKLSAGDIDQLWINPMTAGGLSAREISDAWFYSVRYTTKIGEVTRRFLEVICDDECVSGAAVP